MPVTLTGGNFQNPLGTVISGTLVMLLNQDADFYHSRIIELSSELFTPDNDCLELWKVQTEQKGKIIVLPDRLS